ncbi:MAG TPA: aldo/keto reductase [Victivallales bacterium]|nr:aldo/keto reductase [Victivallales bacterium]HRR06389.1 aldo/keto reductase [Victivallales bacterium]HRR29511.1 aldo/keto reductase [Victivallales bacterium]
MMNYRNLGNSGLKISELSFGSWVTFGNQIDISEASKILKTAYDAGINFFDNAEAYAAGKSEEIMGKALKKLSWDRDSYIISSKVFFGSKNNPLPTQKGLSRKHIIEACNQALQRFQTDYIDLYFCHRPDPETPIEETVRAMNTLIEQGKIFYWGTSEWSAYQILQAFKIAEKLNLIPPTMEQPQYNLFCRERMEKEYLPIFKEYKLGTTIWSPLASGILSGKYNNGIPKDSRMNLPGYEWLKERLLSEEGKIKIEKTKKLAKIAEKIGISLPCMAIAWCLKNQNVSTVILGASKISQLKENLKAVEAVKILDDDTIEEIENVLK